MEKQLTIAIVGNSPSLLEHEWGEEIDSHDIVCRINHFKTKGYEKHTGIKTTDIAFITEAPIIEELISLTKEHRHLIYADQNEWEVRRFDDVYKGVLTREDVSIFDHEKYYTQLKEKLHANNNFHGSTGLIMLQYFADKYPNAVIDSYGITFFADGKKVSNTNMKIQHPDGSVRDCAHDHNAELNYFNKFLKDKVNLHI